MVQTINDTVNAIINNFNKASKKAQKNDTYTKTVKVTDDIRLVYDLGWFDNHHLGNIRIQQKQSNGRYETIGRWVWRDGDFENFVIRTFFSTAEKEVFSNVKTAICNEFGSEKVTVNGNEIIVKGETVTVVASYYGEDGNYCGDEWEMIYFRNDSYFGEIPTGFGYFGYTIDEILDYIKEGLNYVEDEVDDLGF